MNKRAKYRILIVDDEFSVRDSLYNWFREDGYDVETAENGQQALKKLQDKTFDIALLDIKMPGIDGIELQKRINKIAGDTIIIIITAYASVRTAVQALKEGAFDYITKPFDPDELSHLIKNACNQRVLKAENIQLKEHLQELTGFEDIIGESPAMQKVFELVDTVAETDSNVMIRGESGTGKELVARAIHRKSKRRYLPIITVNCGAVAEGIMESELFGHEKGAFTSAHYKRKGKFEMADGGTIFFDEIGNISMKMQMELLRVIETKQITRVGGNENMSIDFRLICATNQDLEKELKEGSFRDDLYYRLNVFSIKLPALKERRSDIPLLVDYFIKKYSNTMNKKVTGIEPQAIDTLVGYSWPGNVRELENAIERAVVVVKDDIISLGDLSFQFDNLPETAGNESLADIEKAHIAEILNSTAWNISKAAKVLQIDRATLYNKIKKYELTAGNA